MIAAVAVVLIAALIGAGLYYRSHRAPRLSDKDTIVIADFANSTGDPVFDDTLKTALAVSLHQSPFLNVLSDNKVAATLRLMTKPPGTKLTPEVAREVCQRAGSKAYIAGSIASLDNQYVIGLKVLNCQTGDTLAQQQVQADGKKNVLNAMDSAAATLRSQLGESLATVQKFDVPLQQATTSSLEALQAYSLGVKAAREKSNRESLPFLEHAIELDPNFAMGYREMGNDYSGLGEVGRASEYFTKAFQLRDHASEREKLIISANYYQNVTGQLDKAAETYQEMIDNYPRDPVGYFNLSEVCTPQGLYEKALELTRQTQQLVPDRVAAVRKPRQHPARLAARFDDARKAIGEAEARKLDDYLLHSQLYALGFIAQNASALAQQLQWFAAHQGVENFGLSLASDTEAYAGHLSQARALTDASCGFCRARRQQRERRHLVGERGNTRGCLRQRRRSAAGRRGWSEAGCRQPGRRHRGRDRLRAGRRLGPRASRRAAAQPALSARHADAVAVAAGDSSPAGAESQRPVGRAARSADCVAAPRVRPDPVRRQHLLPLSHLHSRTGVSRGGTRQGSCRRVPEDSGPQRHGLELLDGSVGAPRRGARQCVAGEELNRCRGRRSRTARALAAYKDFLTLWKDADPDIPIYKEAKAEYARMQ